MDVGYAHVFAQAAKYMYVHSDMHARIVSCSDPLDYSIHKGSGIAPTRPKMHIGNLCHCLLMVHVHLLCVALCTKYMYMSVFPLVYIHNYWALHPVCELFKLVGVACPSGKIWLVYSHYNKSVALWVHV